MPHHTHDAEGSHEHTQLELALAAQVRQLSLSIKRLEENYDMFKIVVDVQRLALLKCVPEGGVVVELPDGEELMLDDGVGITRVRVLARDGYLDIEQA